MPNPNTLCLIDDTLRLIGAFVVVGAIWVALVWALERAAGKL